jgi:hypothetical protein
MCVIGLLVRSYSYNISLKDGTKLQNMIISYIRLLRGGSRIVYPFCDI